jgi:CheY-like chemotaxis protein
MTNLFDDNPGRKLILVVDDDPETKILVESLLRREGFRVQTAANGAEALQRAQVEAPDLVVMDLMMPVLGGYEAIMGLQAAAGARVPVIIHTARRMDPSTLEQMRSEGNVLHVLSKPANLQVLFEFIHRELGTRRLGAEAAA